MTKVIVEPMRTLLLYHEKDQNFVNMITFKAIVGFLFASLVAAITVMSVVSYMNNENTLETARWLRHTHSVVEKCDEILLTYQETRLHINSILIRLDTSNYAAAYVKSIGTLAEKTRELRRLTTDNGHQQSNIDSLEHGLQKFKTICDSLIKLVSEKYSREFTTSLFLNSRTLREDVTLKIKRIQDVEKVLLASRESDNQQSLATFSITFIFLLGGIAALLVSTFLVVRYNFNKRKNAEDKIKQALDAEKELNKLKSNFVAMASHEFRTPLTAILSSTALLESYTNAENQEKIGKHISRIKSSVNNLTSILDEFLSITKIEEGRVHPNLEKIDIQKHLEKFCKNMQPFTKAGQVLVYDHTGENEITTDPVLLGNIVNNMVTNAIKYSPENSAIHITSRVNGMIRLMVKDDGIGIPAEDQAHLFERFYRASNASNVQGTGLGLHIMKHYVEMLKGSVKIESRLGKGTLVEVCFNNKQ